ncbi:hypothetical protein SJA_C2-05860 [Sphingobium indicum UT26S]|uniref:Uncharacterized protein n=1 Tax=Sphingobium indicum (strain DSM 16413 / CCM 7287 / MTCC 6362 / UT26 / NBRC 101211 / UT26S) TaxID=452662 RepID=D4Z791_SPHIU|nr:hypothetical protein SJA_C2-05860 [Sphingobium indicum UT26S]
MLSGPVPPVLNLLPARRIAPAPLRVRKMVGAGSFATALNIMDFHGHEKGGGMAAPADRVPPPPRGGIGAGSARPSGSKCLNLTGIILSWSQAAPRQCRAVPAAGGCDPVSCGTMHEIPQRT